jgi:acyl-CoA thioesterase
MGGDLMNATRSAADIARMCAEAMWADDAASRGLGMRIVEIGPGTAALDMEVGPAMVNGHGLCHGGYIFTLADSAFAFACNSYDQRCVAQHCAITFVSPGRLGDRLIARCTERHRAGRSGIYDITVSTGDGRIVAEFRGHSRSIEGRLLDQPAARPHIPEDKGNHPA